MPAKKHGLVEHSRKLPLDQKSSDEVRLVFHFDVSKTNMLSSCMKIDMCAQECGRWYGPWCDPIGTRDVDFEAKEQQADRLER